MVLKDKHPYLIYMVMELAETTLDYQIKKHRENKTQFPPEKVMELAYTCFKTLSDLQNDYEIAHRDIKPSNILYFSDGSYKLADFGEAK